MATPTNTRTGKVIKNYSTMHVALGEKVSLSSLQEEIGLSKNKLTWKVSESEHVRVSQTDDVFVAQGTGEATLTAVEKVDGKEIEHKWKINVIGKTRRFSDELENFMPMASDSEKLKLAELGIDSHSAFLRKVSQKGEKKVAKELDVPEPTVRLWQSYASLMTIPEMTYDIAYPAALIGIRKPADLLKSNPDSFRKRLELLLDGSIKLKRPIESLPNIATIDKAFNQARKLVKDDIRIDTLKTQLEKLETEFRPSLPRTISGTIMYKKDSTNNDVEWKPKAGFKVQLSGIASPTQDKTQDNKDLITYSGADGRFTIVMPERYNMQEALTFTVSENENDPAVLTRKSILGGTGARSVTFVRLATEIIQNNKVWIDSGEVDEEGQPKKSVFSCSKICSDIKRLNVLKEENDKLKDLIEEQIKKEKEEKERKEKWQKEQDKLEQQRESLLSQKDKAKEKRKQALKNIIAELQQVKQSWNNESVAQYYEQSNNNTLPNAVFVSNNNPSIQPVFSSGSNDEDKLIERLQERLQERLDSLERDIINFAVGNDNFGNTETENIPTWEEIDKNPNGTLKDLLDREQNFLMPEGEFLNLNMGHYVLHAHELTKEAQIVKKELVKIVAQLNSLLESQQSYPETQQKDCSFEEYIVQKTGYTGITTDYQHKTDPEKWVDNHEKYQEIWKEYQEIWNKLSGQNDETPESLLYRLLSNAEPYADMGNFIITENALGTLAGKPSAMPSVCLMGEGSDAVYLPTDTAPSRVFSYSMIHRLIEPDIQKGEREKVTEPLDIAGFREKLHTDKTAKDQGIATTLGMGYVLNMHQSWVPDGFALGSLLHSLVLAPGEEQRIIIKEHQESYSVNDEASAMDNIAESYANFQQDNESAAFSNAVDRFSAAHSDYSYYSQASSQSKSRLGFFFGLLGGTSASSTNRGGGSSNASQTDRYDEVSQAAQSFQSTIKTESERIACAKRASIRVATSNEIESVASKIIANHNHSHVMTVQYWEVMRRYRMETCISGVDLVLFVPLKPVAFLPEEDEKHADWHKFILDPSVVSSMERTRFNYRYAPLLKHADILMNALPYVYRSGLELIKRFASYANWKYVQKSVSNTDTTITLTLNGNFLECDKLTAYLTFFSGRNRIYGRTKSKDVLPIHPSMNTRDKVLRFMRKAREGKYVCYLTAELKDKGVIELPTSGCVEIPENEPLGYAEYDVGKEVSKWEFEFTLPGHISQDEIASIVIENQYGDYHYLLSQDTQYLTDVEKKALENYQHTLMDYTKDDDNISGDIKRLQHYANCLPEWYNKPEVVVAASSIRAMGDIDITYTLSGRSGPENDHLSSKYVIDMANDGIPRMFPQDVEKMEKTLHHVVSDTLGYSQRIWASLSDDERILLLEPYTIDMDFSKLKTKDNVNAGKNENSGKGENGNADKDEDTSTPLLNCVNPKKVLGYYGNCMLLPFTFPQDLAEYLGKTAGEIQDELYRYHTTSFRVPSTVVSVATEGMVGEAVLSATNVSEKVDLTRFWNWKDSDIDHINIDQSSFRNNSSLLENAQAMAISAPTQSVAPTAHIDSGSLAAALLARSPAQFVDALGNTDLRDLLKSTDNNASAGREAAVQASSGMVNTAVQAAADVAKAYFGATAKKPDSSNNSNSAKPDGSNNSNGAKPDGLNNSNGVKPDGSNNSNGAKPDGLNNSNGVKPDGSNNSNGVKPDGSNNSNGAKPDDSDNSDSTKPGCSDNSNNSISQSESPYSPTSLEALGNEAIQAMLNSENPISFYAKYFEISEAEAKKEIEFLVKDFFQKNNINEENLLSALANKLNQ